MRDQDFSDVLDRACRSAGIDPEGNASHGGPRLARGAASRLQQLADRIAELAGRATQAATTSFDFYSEHQSERPAPRPHKPSDPEAVAHELRITAKMTFSDLTRLRREFALANHPDRVELAEREEATRRMMIANMLIDRELKRRHAPPQTSNR
jgi:hypothetical protein